MNNIQGKNNIDLRPASKKDKSKVYQWLTQSNVTSEMMGPPNFPEVIIPSWEEFCDDYLDHYFDSSNESLGRSFIIMLGSIEVGHINYNEVDQISKSTEIDIWMKDLKYCGKAFGTEAILLLCKYVENKFGIQKAYICPSRRNSNAILAYKKCGFKEVSMDCDESKKDYYDTVIMVKDLKETGKSQ